MISSRAHEVTYLVVTIISVWIGSFAIWTASLLLANLFAEFGADLPQSTIVILQLSQVYMPFVFAAVCTGLLVYLLFKNKKYVLSASLIILTITVIYLGLALFLLVTPTSKCGNYWPEWPSESTDVSVKKKDLC